ncbi:unnamed protein product [Vitrella brassicaformis CCMP3155]|uniref:Uncharacterized protein n=1 Tax=Vitrella brassicaformis (strain CCMP3155) TaxID=1169540 RepID=A0A0G4G9E9_VITBC|nr:unnamed protein product [Vitrella brassicaformis CCMP3155]|eukprot:CEM25552.1 unnamed protein product [Vitrella brassicaformis CCMP3155]
MSRLTEMAACGSLSKQHPCADAQAAVSAMRRTRDNCELGSEERDDEMAGSELLAAVEELVGCYAGHPRDVRKRVRELDGEKGEELLLLLLDKLSTDIRDARSLEWVNSLLTSKISQMDITGLSESSATADPPQTEVLQRLHELVSDRAESQPQALRLKGRLASLESAVRLRLRLQSQDNLTGSNTRPAMNEMQDQEQDQQQQRALPAAPPRSRLPLPPPPAAHLRHHHPQQVVGAGRPKVLSKRIRKASPIKPRSDDEKTSDSTSE